ncbi:LOW QUALITY PROTEIN: hypothetical protein HID58_067884 [Brassica napus]|uniref:Uncharacterized protein n=2 Tax=Brassica napus TaxID=3708 RepID=A0ABQ7ZJS2_BRANA|nr:LOW QUALITY PROTEIN: hypothetical protein HID58_067884 [Brassica napus]
MERDFDVHVVVELYFSELKASHCRKVVVTRLLIQQSNIASAQALNHRYHRYVHHVPYGRHNPSCGEADSYFSNLLNFFPRVLYYQFDCSALNLLASKAFDLPHPTKGRSSSYLIYVLLLSDEAMTIQHTGNKNTKPLNVSPSLTTGLPSTDIARLKSERLRDHGEEGTNAVSYEPAADKTRHQGETLR